MKTISLNVNGKPMSAIAEPRTLLSDFLRHLLGLTGTHVGCEHGVCGACTVLFDGEPVRAYYPEELLVPWAAMRLNAPVKWIEDRSEHFVATTHEREQIHDAEIALTADGRILGVKDEFLCDTGAYDPYGLTVPLNSQCTLLGPYDIAHYDSRFRVIFTHKTTVTPYRGAGR